MEKTKFTTTRWLIMKLNDKSIIIQPKEVNRHAPINRVLNQVGYFSYLVENFGDEVFMLTYDPKDEETQKHTLLITKFMKDQGTIILTDMSSKDQARVDALIEKHMISNENELNDVA